MTYHNFVVVLLHTPNNKLVNLGKLRQNNYLFIFILHIVHLFFNMWQKEFIINIFSHNFCHILSKIEFLCIISLNVTKFGGDNLSDFSTQLKSAIDISGYSIYSIAKEINYDRATLTNQINGQRKMTKDVFMKILNKLNITVPAKQNLIQSFHYDIFGEYFDTFETVKESFETYSKISCVKKNINLFNSHFCKATGNDMIKIDGEILIIDAVKDAIFSEIGNNKNKMPTVLFNLDLTKTEIQHIIQSVYMRGEKINIKNLITFSINETDKVENYIKFIKILPLLLNGYCPYYYFTEHNIESELSLLFPYYLITSEKIILISTNFNQAVILSDKTIIKAYTNEFKLKLSNSKQFKYESVSFFKMPYVFHKCIDTQEKSKIYCFNEKFCALPFLSKEHLTYMFSDTVNNCDEIIDDLLDCYKTINDFISFTPVETLTEFAETGNEGHTTNDYSKPLTVQQRIEVLDSIRTCIKNGGKYYFVRRENFFCNNLTFNVVSDSQIIFFTFEKDTNKNSMSVLTIPNGLLGELKTFFKSLRKSCYVLSKEESLQAINNAIKYAKSLQEK